ncbi:hypothetical protein [Pseudoalteromonas sp. McH1-42]|uniref:hypothetical protein n=1 Tax=Pseudoalteromonas sp. McH1-42 TaxID=2917752 RepID=UPI001EF4A686|nr:hypothetical protein [Pseudoalteromonas sp. McH1-42]MCG7560859.1 hypothetical protein [Pseudoalteromonas sp. McH1-42]
MFFPINTLKAFHASALFIALTIITSIVGMKLSTHSKPILELSFISSVVAMYIHGGALLVYFIIDEKVQVWKKAKDLIKRYYKLKDLTDKEENNLKGESSYQSRKEISEIIAKHEQSAEKARTQLEKVSTIANILSILGLTATTSSLLAYLYPTHVWALSAAIIIPFFIITPILLYVANIKCMPTED